MKKNNILFLASFLWGLGEGKGMPSVNNTLKGLVNQDYNVFVFLPCSKNETKIQNGVNIFYCKVPFYNIHFDSNLLQGIKNKIDLLLINFIFFIKGIALSKKIKFDLLYCSSSIPTLSTFFLSRIFNVPNITRLYGVWNFYKHQNNFLWRLMHIEIVLAFKLPAKLYIITNDGTFGDKIAQRYKIAKEKIRFWLNGVDNPNFAIEVAIKIVRKELNIKETDLVLLIVSRLVRGKGVDRAIQALRGVIINHNNVKLVIVGDGEERKKLENLAGNLNLKNNIRFIGATSHGEVNKFYSMADIFISMYDVSNVGNPLLEAMSFGLPIITLGVGGTSEIVINNKNGILIPFSGDEKQIIESLSREIVNLISNESLRERLGENTKRFANERFLTWDKRIDLEIKEINKLIG